LEGQDVNNIFTKEVDLCKAFIETLPKGWTNYNETGGYDILLVHDETGFQIGVEAKLRLNAKVICQAMSGLNSVYDHSGPDCRAVLVPSGVNLQQFKILVVTTKAA
jgi:hypothetical protein